MSADREWRASLANKLYHVAQGTHTSSTWGFRLYNVSVLDAVELRVGPNDVRRIGTDDLQGLADALKSHGG